MLWNQVLSVSTAKIRLGKILPWFPSTCSQIEADRLPILETGQFRFKDHLDSGSSFSLNQCQVWWWLLRCTWLSYEVITDGKYQHLCPLGRVRSQLHSNKHSSGSCFGNTRLLFPTADVSVWGTGQRMTLRSENQNRPNAAARGKGAGKSFHVS